MTRSRLAARTSLLLATLAAVLLAAVGWQLLGPHASPSGASAAVGVRISAVVVGLKQGAFKGEDNPGRKGTEGQITVLAFSAELNSPRDPASGLPTGKRQWKPLVITHVMGGSSPQFLAAAATNETLKSVTINFYHTNIKGQEINYYRVTLTNATVSNVHQYTSGQDVLEDDSFTFQKIEEQDFVAKTDFIDDFSTDLS